jgi:hypothetical protein
LFKFKLYGYLHLFFTFTFLLSFLAIVN